MTEASKPQDQLSCPVCLQPLKDPVIVPCGHSFCLDCVTGCWDQEDQKGTSSCPQCRHKPVPGPGIQIVLPPEPRSRQEFLEYSCKLTLDPNTANKHLCLSAGNTVVTNNYADQSYPDHPDRFEGCCQVLCREGVSGRCYWEAEWSGPRGVSIAVSYRSIIRTGEGPDVFGWSDQSWSLFCHPVTCSFSHNNIEREIPGVTLSSRIGVYVDHRAGTLSFYSVSDMMTLLHRVQTSFTQPLYAGFWVACESEVSLCQLSTQHQH